MSGEIVVNHEMLNEMKNVLKLDSRINIEMYAINNKLREDKIDFMYLDYNDMKVLEKYDFKNIFNDALDIMRFRLFGDENVKAEIVIEELKDKVERLKDNKWYYYTHKLVIKKI